MKRCAVLLFSPLLLSCAVHVHVHEAPEAVASADAIAPEQRMVRGVVRDSAGAGVEARIALVLREGGGSTATTTGPDGRFALPGFHAEDITLHASTSDGRVATSAAQPSDGEIELVLRPGAVFVIELEGRDKVRCAVFADGLRIEDFTLRAGAPENVVVPAGEQRVRIYDGDTVLQERHFSAKVGATESIRMQPHP